MRDPSADGLQMVSAREQQAGLAVALSRDEAHVRRRWVQRSRSAEARVAMWIHERTSIGVPVSKEAWSEDEVAVTPRTDGMARVR